MTISFVNSSTTGVLASGTTDVSLPASMSEDDVVLVAITSDTAHPTVNSSGWTQVYEESEFGTFSSLYYKAMGSSPDSNINVTTGTNAPLSVVCQAFRGVSPQNPVKQHDTAAEITDNPNPPSLSSVTDNSWIIAIGHLDDEDVAGSVVHNGGYTNLAAADVDEGNASTTMMASKAATGSTENPDAFSSSGSDANIGASVELQDAGALFTKAIVDNDDDGAELEGLANWTPINDSANRIAVGYNSPFGVGVHGGWRFTNVNIEKGINIVYAAMVLNQRNTSGSGVSQGTWYGWDTDNAAVFDGTTNYPSNLTKTTASYPWLDSTSGSLALIEHEVTDIVQEIVDRSGWSSGNSMSLFGS